MATILHEVHIGYTAAWPLISADLNGDGRAEFLLGSCDARFLRAMDANGRALWHLCLSNFADGQSLPVDAFDFDGDGCAEVFVPDELGRRIIRLDGKTGRVTARSQELPGNGLDGISAPYGFMQYPTVRPKQWNGKGPALYASCKGGFVVALDSDLKLLWVRDKLGSSIEHYVFRGDLDGDGMDEVAVSAEDTASFYLIDHNETLLHTVPVTTVLGNDTHVDFAVIADVDEDGKPEIVSSTGFALLERDGSVRWRRQNAETGLTHGQWAQVAKIRPDVPGKQILFLNAAGGLGQGILALYAADGTELWRFNQFRSTVYGAGFIDRTGSGQLEIYACEGGRRDWLRGLNNVYWDRNRQITDPAETYGVYFLSATGELRDQLPFVDIGGIGAYDGVYGGAVTSTVVDLEGDGRQAVALLTFDGRLLIVG